MAASSGKAGDATRPRGRKVLAVFGQISAADWGERGSHLRYALDLTDVALWQMDEVARIALATNVN